MPVFLLMLLQADGGEPRMLAQHMESWDMCRLAAGAEESKGHPSSCGTLHGVQQYTAANGFDGGRVLMTNGEKFYIFVPK